LKRAFEDGLADLVDAGKQIHYVAAGHYENYNDPEEWVRADFWAELVYYYKYPVSRIGIEVPVPDRVPGDFADLVVYADDTSTTPFAVIETKAEGISAAEFDQAVEQAVGNGTWAKMRADYVMVVAGITRRTLDVAHFGIRERTKNRISDLPINYMAPEAYRFKKGAPGDPNELRSVTRDEMLVVLSKCHDTLWGGGRLSPPQAFSELCKVIFIKIADEKGTKRGTPYEVQIKTGESAGALRDRLVRIYDDHRRKEPDIFTSDLGIPAETLRRVVEHIQPVSISATEIDVKGLAFERFMDGFFKGDFGQYFTPREVVHFIVEMLGVEPGDFVIDPAVGSAGFLLHALEQVRRKVDEYAEPGSQAAYRMWSDFANQQLFGIEINDEIARVAKMNMILHGDGHTNVVCADALSPQHTLSRLNRGIKFGEFDVVLTNPPFGASIRLDERPFLASFEHLGNTRTSKGKLIPRKAQASEIVYLERIWQLLRPGGRAGIVLPDGVLTNSRTKYVRSFILDHFQVLAIVSLPISAFMHYGAGVKASVVFLRKLNEGEPAATGAAVFMAEAEMVGYDATGRSCSNQLPEIVEAYRKFLGDPAHEVVDVPDVRVILGGGE
jgi:type I restriction enzyme M protein